MHLIEVKSPEEERTFLQVHVDCNKDNPQWIRPLDKDIKAVFDKSKNKSFKFGEIIRWILLDDGNKPVGKIAAFIHKKYKNKGDACKVGGVGFFDCINNLDYSQLLFSKAQTWLSERGVQAMDGPINFGERNMWWGLLVDGFHEPLYGMNYNPPYYQNLFETYGFKNFYNQICWAIPLAKNTQLQDKFYTAHRKYADNEDFKASIIKKNQESKFTKDFCAVYNKAWAQHEGNKMINEKQALIIYRQMKQIMDEDLFWFAYYRNEPIAMWISIPDINQIIKKLNGKFDLWSKLKFLFYRWNGSITRFVGVIYGIVPEFHGSGIDYYMIVEAEKVIKSKRRYSEVELQWQGDFNPKMLNISRNLGAIQNRRLVTYRYLFDQNAPFHRHPILN